MAPDQEPTDRDAAVRTMLVEHVTRPKEAPAMRLAPGRMRSGLVTAVVLVVIIAVSVLAVRFGSGRSAPADGGVPTAAVSTDSTDSTERALPSMTVPAGKLLGKITSDDGPVQTLVVHPDGLALATVFTCTGGGEDEEYTIRAPHAIDEAGGCSGGSGGRSSKGTPGSLTITVTTEKDMRWSFTVVGVPETYVTPQPVVSPTDSSGKPVPFCTAAELTAEYETTPMPDGVTEAAGGQVVFTNTGSATCALAGHPAMWFADQGAPLGNAALERTDERSSEEKGLKPVIVPAGGKAYSQLDYYLPNYYPANDVAPCAVLKVHSIHIDIANRLAGAAQQGTFDVETPTITGCTNSAWGIYGKYGQLSTTIFVDYSSDSKG